MALTDKQDRFCEEYVIDLNATQAAIRAGYAESGARTEGARLLANANIQERITQLKKEISERNNITVDKYVNILDKLATFDISELYEDNGSLKSIHDIPEDARLAIESLDTDEMKMEGLVIGQVKKLKLTSRRAAIDLLLKHLGGYEKDNAQKPTIVNIPPIKWVKSK